MSIEECEVTLHVICKKIAQRVEHLGPAAKDRAIIPMYELNSVYRGEFTISSAQRRLWSMDRIQKDVIDKIVFRPVNETWKREPNAKYRGVSGGIKLVMSVYVRICEDADIFDNRVCLICESVFRRTTDANP